jgi:hypothetical protein
MAVGQTRHQTLSHESFSIYYSLPRHAGQNLDRCVCAHQPKTKLLENKDSVVAVKLAPHEEFHLVHFKAPCWEIRQGVFVFNHEWTRMLWPRLCERKIFRQNLQNVQNPNSVDFSSFCPKRFSRTAHRGRWLQKSPQRVFVCASYEIRSKTSTLCVSLAMKSRISVCWDRKRSTITSVPQLPTRSQINFGGEPSATLLAAYSNAGTGD